MKERINTSHKRDFPSVIYIIYLVIAAVMLFIIFSNLFFRDKPSAYYGLDSYFDISDEWYGESGQPIDFSNFEQHQNEDGVIWMYYTIPSGLRGYDSIVFRSKNATVSAFIDDNPVYETDITNAPFYNHSPGTRWNVIALGGAVEGGKVALRVSLAYQDSRCKVDHLYMGDRASILLGIIDSKGVGLLISLLMLFVGVIYLISNLIMNWSVPVKDNSLRYLGMFAIICSVWCLLETNVFQLFSTHLRLIQTADNMMLVLGALPLFLYLDSSYGIFKNKLLKLLCIVDVCYIGISTGSQLLGLWDFHQTLDGAVISYGVASLILIFSIYRSAKRDKKKRRAYDFELICQGLGVVVLGVSVFFEFVRYLASDVLDRAFIIRFGLFFCILFLGSGNIHRMIQLVKQGARAEIVSKLAYEDGLTQLANRTAYFEKIKSIIDAPVKKHLGILYLDINNLKTVNDTKGHPIGDELIVACAGIIEQSFGEVGHAYRTGGDEFVVLIDDNEPDKLYKSALARFHELVYTYNHEARYPFEIAIAHGVAYCGDLTADGIARAEKEADKEMYRNKYEMKNRSVYEPIALTL